MVSIISLLCLGLAVTPVLAKTPTLLVLGDSLSAGYGLHRAEAYPALLAREAATAGIDLHVINAGINGDTSRGGLRRLPHLLERRVDVLVIELGINDIFRGRPAAEIEANLQSIIDLAKKRQPDVRIVIAGLQSPQPSSDPYLEAFRSMFSDLAERNHVALVPFLLRGVLGDPALNLPDLIHPNANGQKILAANVWPVVEKVLRGE